MPVSIVLSALTYRTPDDQPLFENLDLSFGARRTGLIGRNGTGKSTLLRLIARAAQPVSGRISVSGTIGMLDQTVRDGATRLVETLGIAGAKARLDRLEAGTGTIEDSAEADWGLPERLAGILDTMGLPNIDLSRQLDSLSGGQQTRLRLAKLLLDNPDMILLDEPTNNLDAEGRAAIATVLRGWRGGAIVVSHDRALLGEMDAIVELTSLGAKTYGGNWDHYVARKALDLAAAEHGLATAERTVAEVDRRVHAQVERKARKDSAGKAKRARGDVPKILLNGMRDRAQDTGGQNARLAGRMRESAETAAAEARALIEILQPLSVKLVPTGLPAGRVVLEASGLSGGPVPGKPIIADFDLQIVGPERVAIIGPNGSGKTTLLRLLTGNMASTSGSIRWNGRWAFLVAAGLRTHHSRRL